MAYLHYWLLFAFIGDVIMKLIQLARFGEAPPERTRKEYVGDLAINLATLMAILMLWKS